MSRVRTSIAGLSIAFIITACGSGPDSTGSSQGGSGGTSVTDTGGSGGDSSGGAGSGSGGNSSGGAAGSASGGAAGSSNGGVAGSTRGGSGGNASGGAAGRSSGGAAGNPSGGNTTSQGGNAGSSGSSQGQTGGVQGNGGQQTGGDPGSGGDTQPGSGGSTPPPPEPQVVTSAQGAYWKETTWTEVTTGTVNVTVNDTKTYQDWAGFGGTFNEAGWDALSVLSSQDRDRAIQLLFSATDGANFAYGRVPIGASDYAMDRYTLDENSGDYAMDKFSIERDKQKLIPYIKAALAIKPDVHLWASPWTPPTWMKTGSYTADGKEGWDGGNMKDDAQVLKAFAIYLAKFVEEYDKEDITIEAVHPQNEPGYATRYPSCLWTASLFNKFINTYMGPTFEERGVKAKIYVGTMSNNDSGKDGTIISTVTGDTSSMKYVKGAGLQWNMISYSGSLANKGLQVVQSEHKCGNYPWNPGGGLPAFDANKPQNDHAYGVESWGYIRDWVKAGVHVYSAWNMVLDTAGKNLDTTRPWPQNALLVVDRGSKTLTLTPAYYVFRHASQYVDPGSKRVDTSGDDSLAFKNPDGSIVTVIFNSGGAKKEIVSVGGKKLQFDMPGNGWATVNWK